VFILGCNDDYVGAAFHWECGYVKRQIKINNPQFNKCCLGLVRDFISDGDGPVGSQRSAHVKALHEYFILHVYSGNYNNIAPVEQVGRIRQMEQILRFLHIDLNYAICIHDKSVRSRIIACLFLIFNKLFG